MDADGHGFSLADNGFAEDFEVHFLVMVLHLVESPFPSLVLIGVDPRPSAVELNCSG